MNFLEKIAEPRRLILAWQGGEGTSRIRWSVGELLRAGIGGSVRFRYLTESPDLEQARNEGFINFPAFRKIGPNYDIGVVETFMRRLPPQTRGDYSQYLEQFRLTHLTQVSDFALLGITGAKLPSDGFSIVNPLEGIRDPCDVMLEVAGFRHTTEIPLENLTVGMEAMLEAESDNLHDQDAVLIRVTGQKIGYVPRQQAVTIRQLLTRGSIQGHIERINGTAARPLVFLFLRITPHANERSWAGLH